MPTTKIRIENTRANLESQLCSVLRQLNSSSNHIESSAVMSRDGISIASVLVDGVDSDRVSAMCAALLGLADTTAKELNRGDLKQVLIHGSNGFMLISHVGNKAVLAVASKPGTNLGMVFVEANKASKKIEAILSQSR